MAIVECGEPQVADVTLPNPCFSAGSEQYLHIYSLYEGRDENALLGLYTYQRHTNM